MSHTYLGVENSEIERTVVFTDSMLVLFMYLFCKLLEKDSLNNQQLSVYNNYRKELHDLPTTCFELCLEEIY